MLYKNCKRWVVKTLYPQSPTKVQTMLFQRQIISMHANGKFQTISSLEMISFEGKTQWEIPSGGYQCFPYGFKIDHLSRLIGPSLIGFGSQVQHRSNSSIVVAKRGSWSLIDLRLSTFVTRRIKHPLTREPLEAIFGFKSDFMVLQGPTGGYHRKDSRFADLKKPCGRWSLWTIKCFQPFLSPCWQYDFENWPSAVFENLSVGPDGWDICKIDRLQIL